MFIFTGEMSVVSHPATRRAIMGRQRSCCWIPWIFHLREFTPSGVRPIRIRKPSVMAAYYWTSFLFKNGYPVFDWIWLGLGEDGHTASIFPDQIGLWTSKRPCVVARHPQTGQKRITITGGVINAAHRVAFLVAGKSKSKVVNEIVMKEGDYLDYPAFYVAPHSGHTLSGTWIWRPPAGCNPPKLPNQWNPDLQCPIPRSLNPVPISRPRFPLPIWKHRCHVKSRRFLFVSIERFHRYSPVHQISLQWHEGVPR